MLSKDQVQHIARLARLNLKNSEVDTYSKQLSDVLGYFEQLQEIDSMDISYDYQVAGLKNVTRLDQIEPIDEEMRNKLIGELSDKEGELLKVPGVFGIEE